MDLKHNMMLFEVSSGCFCFCLHYLVVVTSVTNDAFMVLLSCFFMLEIFKAKHVGTLCLK